MLFPTCVPNCSPDLFVHKYFVSQRFFPSKNYFIAYCRVVEEPLSHIPPQSCNILLGNISPGMGGKAEQPIVIH